MTPDEKEFYDSIGPLQRIEDEMEWLRVTLEMQKRIAELEKATQDLLDEGSALFPRDDEYWVVHFRVEAVLKGDYGDKGSK